MPWVTKEPKIDIQARWPQVTPIEKYGAIQAFLTNEKEVRTTLDELQAETAKCSGYDAFIDFLRQRETQLGFDLETVTVNSVLSPASFLQIVNAKKPIYDIGANRTHGWVTHRVQWILIAIFDREARFLVEPNCTIADLYKGMAKGYKTGVNQSLWDDLLDNGQKGQAGAREGTASQPEYLHDQLVKYEYPKLYKIWP